VPSVASTSSAQRAVLWFAAGLLVAALAHLTQGSLQEPALTLRVGADSAASQFISGELGSIPLTEGTGYDGRYSYLVARDPFALEGLADLEGIGGYRFRRVLYSWLGGGFGLLPPRGVVWGLIAWSALGFAASAAALSMLTDLLGARWWMPLGALASVGLLLSVQLSTADALALGLGLWGVVLWLRGRVGWALVALATAALTKEYYLLFAIGVIGWDLRRRGWRVSIGSLVVTAVPLGAWVVWLALHTGDALSSQDNLSLPFVGIVQGAAKWASRGDVALGTLTLASAIAATVAVAVARDRLLSWLTIPWILLALVSSANVWQFGSNAIRVFAPLWALSWVAIAVLITRPHEAPSITA
jgi:hypothetical protein